MSGSLTGRKLAIILFVTMLIFWSCLILYLMVGEHNFDPDSHLAKKVSSEYGILTQFGEIIRPELFQ